MRKRRPVFKPNLARAGEIMQKKKKKSWKNRNMHPERETRDFSFSYFILGTITSCHSAQHSVIRLTMYASLEEHVPSLLYKITQVHKS